LDNTDDEIESESDDEEEIEQQKKKRKTFAYTSKHKLLTNLFIRQNIPWNVVESEEFLDFFKIFRS